MTKIVPLLVLTASCGSAMVQPERPVTAAADSPPPSPWTDSAAAGVDHPELAALLRDHWEWALEHSPRWATELGDHRYDDRIADESRAATLSRREQRRAFLARADAIEPEGLTEVEATSLTLLAERLRAEIGTERCELELWSLSAMSNPVSDWNYLPRMHAVRSVHDGDNLLARYAAIGPSIDHVIDKLRIGARQGLFASAETTRRVLAMTRAQLEEPLDEWPLMSPRQAATEWPAPAREAFERRLTDAVQNGIRPALGRFADVLERELLPHARPDDRAGVGALPDGDACYGAQIRSHTGLERSAEDIHAVGVREMERINAQMRELGERLFGTDDLAAILERLRSDEALYFDSEEAVEDKARACVDAARAAMPEWFGVLPRAPVTVVRVPEYEAPFTTIAYYRPPHADGSKPGEYFVNTTQPTTRPRFQAAVLAYHEAIPGHHLQIAIAQELEGIPVFRRHVHHTAYVEGWALYTERLADEMGLYESDLDRMGMLSYDAWRAARLVVDTGIHAMGWSRQQAIDYMLAHTALAPNNVDNEVDRYVSWPGQALAYKLGQLEILRLREQARAGLGEAFDVKGFHDAVLTSGAVSLAVLERNVRAWAQRHRTR